MTIATVIVSATANTIPRFQWSSDGLLVGTL